MGSKEPKVTATYQKIKPDEFVCQGELQKMPCLLPDIPNAVYHGDDFKDFIGHSGLVKVLDSLAHFKSYQIENKSTPAMEFGTAAHIFMLEDPKEKIKVCDLTKKNGDAIDYWSARAQDCKKESVGKDGCEAYILKKEWAKLEKMKDRLYRHVKVKEALTYGVAEYSGFFLDDMFQDIKGKIRLDWWRKDPPYIYDYKTAACSKEREFKMDAYKYGYDVQAAWYVRGMKIITGDDYRFFFIVQEKEPPYAVNFYVCSDRFLRLGDIRIKRALKSYFMAIENPELFKNVLNMKLWPDDTIELDPPGYAEKENPEPKEDSEETEFDKIGITPL